MDSRKKESSKGVIGGLITGSSNLVQGLSSGITGLVTRPMEGGRKGGAAGFVMGMGQGVVGAAVSPIVGVADGIAAVAHGISTQISQQAKLRQMRPPRVLRRVVLGTEEISGSLLEPLDSRTIEIATLLERRASKRSMEDAMKAFIPLSDKEDAIISSLSFGIYNRVTGETSVSLEFENISHFKLSKADTSVIEVFCMATEGEGVYTVSAIKCTDSYTANVLHSELLGHADSMQNPSAIS